MLHKIAAAFVVGLLAVFCCGLTVLADVQITPVFGEIDVVADEGVVVTVSTVSTQYGKNVRFSVRTEGDYLLRGIEVVDELGNQIDFSIAGEYKYCFTMPEGNVQIIIRAEDFGDATRADCALALWSLTDEAKEADNNVSSLKRSYKSGDCDKSDGYCSIIGKDGVRRTERQTADTTYFKDVDPDAEYAEAVAWITSNCILPETDDGIFAPDETITREELADVIYRFAIWYGIDGETDVEVLSGAVDREFISDWALKPVCWAVSNGILNKENGVVGYFNPLETITRSELKTSVERLSDFLAQSDEPEIP